MDYFKNLFQKKETRSQSANIQNNMNNSIPTTNTRTSIFKPSEIKSVPTNVKETNPTINSDKNNKIVNDNEKKSVHDANI